jgi:histidine triad (HIT) family protein
MATLFSRIVAGEIPCHKVAETDEFLAFLDISPRTKGHTLCIPKKEVDYIFDLDDAHLAGLMQFSKRVAAALQKTVPCLRVGVAVVGLEVPHAHVHLFPLNSMADFGFSHAPVAFTAAELSELATAIGRNFEV